MFGKIVCGIIGGLMVTLLSSGVFGPIIALSSTLAESISGFLFWGIWLAAMAMALYSSRTGKAWRKLLLVSAILCFLTPFSAILITGAIAVETTSAFQLSALLGFAGGALVASVIMVILGVFFLVLGLLVGRNKKDKTAVGEASAPVI